MAPRLGVVSEVRALVAGSVFERGKEIANSGKVSQIVWSHGPHLLRSSALCKGSKDSTTYEVVISMDGDSTLSPLCQCTCPAAAQAKGGLCKHVIGLMLLRVRELSKIRQPPCERPQAVNEYKKASIDTQETEPWVESQESNLSKDTSLARTLQKGGMRVLPAWMSGKGRAEALKASKSSPKRKKPVKDVGGEKGSALKNKKGTGSRKRTKRLEIRDSDEEQEGADTDNNDDIEVSEESGSGKEKGKDKKLECNDSSEEWERQDIVRLSAATSSKQTMAETVKNSGVFSHRAKTRRQETGDHDKLKNNDETLYNGQLVKSAGKRKSRKEPLSMAKKDATSRSKNQKVLEDSELSEEDVPEIHDDGVEFVLDLTTKDLVSLAKKHLEGEQESKKAAKHACNSEEKEASIFSSRGWNEAMNVEAEPKSILGQVLYKDTLQPPLGGNDSSFPDMPPNKSPKKALANDSSKIAVESKDGIAKDMLGLISHNRSPQKTLANDSSKVTVESTDSIAEDMLGLIFGSSLNVAKSPSKLEEERFSQQVMKTLAENMPKTSRISQVSLPSGEVRPKKKGSLKDKIKMFLD